jgi:hypothetical protein
METHKPKTANINDFREWHNRGELILAPEFQRREVWGLKARSYLIDTILTGFPIPAVYLRQNIDLKTQKTIREVVDGQQRLAAILDFLEDKFIVLKSHSEKYGGLTYSELPDKDKSNFLEYDLLVDFLVGADDIDVLEVFARINSYTIVLNTQEKLNAAYKGEFKRTVFKLGRDHLEFWRKNKVLTNRKIMRMGEAELTTDLVIAMVDGIQDRKKIRYYYEKYDDEFPQKQHVEMAFKRCIDLIAEIYKDSLISSPFRKTTLFYSLFCAFYDLSYGLPKSETRKVAFRSSIYSKVRFALKRLELQLESKGYDAKYANFIDASSRHTTDQSRREIRHNTIIGELLGVL